MRSTDDAKRAPVLSGAAKAGAAVGSLVAVGIALAACGQTDTEQAGSARHSDQAAAAATNRHIPRVEEIGTAADDFETLRDLAAISSALIVAEPTGKHSEVALPEEQGSNPDSPPISFYEMKVDRIVSGSLAKDVIKVVTPGDDVDSGQPVFSEAARTFCTSRRPCMDPTTRSVDTW